MDVFVLNQNLEKIALIDGFKSLIWAKRYAETGDCEIYITATPELLNIFQKGNYILRDDDEMICQIRYIELDTDVENGDYLIIKAVDVKKWLDQRIVWQTMTADGNAEQFLREMVDVSLGSGAEEERQITNLRGERIFGLGAVSGLPEASTEQISYKNVGEKIREYCKMFGWGYSVTLSGGMFLFRIFAGEDKTAEVVFSEDFENLATTKYVDDETNMGNTALIAGEGQGAERIKEVSGTATSTERFEIYVDARDLSKSITWAELTSQYPPQSQDGYGYVDGTEYKMTQVDIQIYTDEQLDELEDEHPDGQREIIDGNLYFRVFDVAIADLPSSTPADDDVVELADLIYKTYLLARGAQKIDEYGRKVSFEGEIVPGQTFTPGVDYKLGDLVTVENSFGISEKARIIEIIEVFDDNGYSVQPKFEYFYKN